MLEFCSVIIVSAFPFHYFSRARFLVSYFMYSIYVPWLLYLASCLMYQHANSDEIIELLLLVVVVVVLN